MNFLTKLLLFAAAGWPIAIDVLCPNEIVPAGISIATQSCLELPLANLDDSAIRPRIMSGPRAIFTRKTSDLDVGHEKISSDIEDVLQLIDDRQIAAIWIFISMLPLSSATVGASVALGDNRRQVVVCIGRLSKKKDSEEQTNESIDTSLAVVRNKIDELFGTDVEIEELAGVDWSLIAARP
ncbi:hypothetical protein [Mariniblastus fucicola]|uniref:Uncharacterized protein n=1 Tax=Mariniblastus fucicola TaxID=980251 RepID=A0A5B9P9A4_9BACT|nr:hypothetical protein [Mariniblastus fucicola]QEG22878.1 hypothetical protein MFFC18_27660 [Mariniblastus fucicola]